MRARTLYCDDGSEIVLPTRWEICGTCQGHGKHSRAVEGDGGGITASEMDEAGEDFERDYFAGYYDRTCEVCNGAGKVQVADFSRMTKQQREDYRAQCRADREIDAIHEAERRAGA